MSSFVRSEWFALLPELWIGAAGLALIFLDLRWKGRHPSRMGSVAACALSPVLPILFWQGSSLPPGEILGGMMRVDSFSLFFKEIFAVAALGVIGMARELEKRLERGHGEFYLLILTATAGMFLAASSANFLMLFVSIELIAISFYVLTSYLQSDLRSLEAGMKYLVLGSLASGLFLYGMAFLYGATGSLQFSVIRAALEKSAMLAPGVLFALVLLVAGMAFKVAAVPFQLWVPDVYQGSPTPVTAFLSIGSKAAGFVVAVRVLLEVFSGHSGQWAALIGWLAGLTILYGNLGAIPQKNIKRLLGYSSIGHAGYILIGVAAGSSLGGTAVNFYLLSYLFTNLAAFLVVAAFSKETGSDEIRDYAGLSKRSPFLAAAMFVALLSLAGVPPMSGFMGKFLLLLAAVREGFFWLAVAGAAAVVVSLYYYLLIVYTMYADPPPDPAPVPVSVSTRLALLSCLAAIFVIGLWQAPFLNLSFNARP